MSEKTIQNIIKIGGTFDRERSVATINGFSFSVVKGCYNHNEHDKHNKIIQGNASTIKESTSCCNLQKYTCSKDITPCEMKRRRTL